MNSVNGWYLRTSDEHYRCHEIYMKHTRGVRISDRVHFKHKHITAPTLTPEDTIVKALNDLTEALREQRNTKGTIEYEALQNFDELMNKIPIQQPTPTQLSTIQQVTFDPAAKPASTTLPTPRVNIETPTPRVQETIPTPRVQEATPTLRVQPTPPSKTTATIDKPLQQNACNTTKKIPTPTQTNCGVRSTKQGT